MKQDYYLLTELADLDAILYLTALLSSSKAD